MKDLNLPVDVDTEELQAIKSDLTRFMMPYKFALDEINTKIDILKQEFQYVHDYNPIEHVKARLKTADSILNKVKRRGYEMSIPSIRENVRDIAGLRITCSFISDIYKISDMLQNLENIELVEYKDYIRQPKPNGYKSLHIILQLPVYMSDRVEKVYVEVQIRTIAMDFWASLEHKIYYKYDKAVPEQLMKDLKEAAETVSRLDEKMEQIHTDMLQVKSEENNLNSSLRDLDLDNKRDPIPDDFYSLYFRTNTR